MSPSFPVPSFEEAFDALINYLQIALKSNDIISIPDEIEKPFRSASYPPDSSVLRKLLKLFDTKQQHHVLQLAPKSFCGIIFVTLHFPYSSTQDKLLHAFMHAFRLFHDGPAAQASLKKCDISSVSIGSIEESRQNISRRLLHTLLRRYVGGGLEYRLRWTIAQFIATLLRDDEVARARIVSYAEIKHLSTLLHDLDDYVGRFLASDIIRHLVYHGTKRPTFWPKGTAKQEIEGFPVDKHSSPAWIGNLQRYFAEIDMTLPFGAGRQCALPIQNLIVNQDLGDRAISDAVVVLSEDFTFVTTSENDGVRVVSFPMFGSVNMTVLRTEIGKEIQVLYPKETGFELCNGYKTAIQNMSIAFEDTADAQTAENIILRAEHELKDMKGAKERGTTVAVSQSKRSIAYINLWSPEAQPQQDTCPKVAQSAQEFRQYGSPSPLQRRSQPVQQRRGTGSETMSETEFLEIDDQPSLVERLRASQEDVRDDQSHSDFNAKVDEALARQRPSRSNTVTALPEPVREEEGATNSPPHLPKPCVERKSASNSTVRPDRSLNTNPNVSGADVKRSSGIIGAIDISPEPPNKTTGASAKLKKASMAKLSALRPQARSSKTASATKPLAGPAARLAGAQPQSSPNKSLKRKSAGAGMTKSPETTEEHSQFDIPDPSSDEEPPQKRTRPNGKQPARKPNASSIKGREPGKGGFKDVTKPAGRPRKTQNVKAAEKPKQSVASTRDRRPAKPKKYVEDSDSDLEEIDNPAVSPQKLSKHDSSHVGQSSTALKTVDKPNHQRRHFSQNSGIPRPSNSKKHEGDTEIQSSPQKTKSRVDKAQSQVAHAQVVQLNEQITTDRSPRAPPPPKPKANEPTSRPDDSDQQGADDTEISEEQAQDSYPMNDPVIHEAMTDSFHTLLQTTMQAGTVADTDKENVPPPVPQTPFGNEKTFVADVNAARSTSPNKTSKSQVPQSPEPAAPLSRTRHAVKAKELTSLGKSTDSTTTHRTNVAKKSEPEPDQDVVGTDVGDIPAEEPIGASTFITDDEVPDEQVNADRRDGPIDGIAEHNGAPIVSEKSDKRLTIDQQGHVEAGISLDADPDTAEVPVTQAAGRYLEEKLTDRREKFERKSPMQNSVDISSTKKRTLNDSPRPIVMKKRQVEEWTAGTSGDIGTLQFNRHRSSMNTCNSAEAPPQGPNAATEPRRGARLSATVRTEELRTPQRKFRSSEEVLTSEKATKRASLVHFTDHGPQNQGVSKKRASESSTEMTAPPPQTHHHQQAKQHEGRDETAETPSRELEVGNERPVSSDFEEGTDPVPRLSADGIDPVPEAHDHGEYNSNQRDNNQHPESHPLIQPEIGILQNHLSYPAAENSGDALAGETYVTPPTQELSSDVKDEELAANDEDEEEESEYRDESESVDISQEKSLAPSGEDSASELEVTATSLDSHPDGAVQSEKVITEARVAPRESIGLSQVMNHVHPQAKEKINTRKLRAVRTEAEANLSFGTSAVVESRIQGSSIHAAKQHITDDKARMAPPEKKGRQSVAQARQPDTLGKEADVRGSSGSHTTTTRAANSISQIRQASVMDAATSVSEPRPRLEIYREPATSAPVRIKRPSIANVSPEPQPTLGTPVPFHARLAYTTAEVVEHDRRKTESFLSEHSGNTTLTNGHSMSTMVQHEPLRQPHFPRGMTETTDGSPSPSSADSASRWDDSNRAQAVIRSPYRSLLEDVKEIADGVLFRLGIEEDAITAKVNILNRGSESFTDDLTASWNKRISHERKKIAQGLVGGRKDLMNTIGKVENDGKGPAQKWEEVERSAQIGMQAEGRNMELLAAIKAMGINLTA